MGNARNNVVWPNRQDCGVGPGRLALLKLSAAPVNDSMGLFSMETSYRPNNT
jgi:hypothetical protein